MPTFRPHTAPLVPAPWVVSPTPWAPPAPAPPQPAPVEEADRYVGRWIAGFITLVVTILLVLVVLELLDVWPR